MRTSIRPLFRAATVALALAACGDHGFDPHGLDGRYVLQSIGGAALPLTLTEPGPGDQPVERFAVGCCALELAGDGSYRLNVSVEIAGGIGQLPRYQSETGRYDVSGTRVRLVSDPVYYDAAHTAPLRESETTFASATAGRLTIDALAVGTTPVSFVYQRQ